MIYSEIIAAAKAYADRSDIEVNSNIDTFLIMVESRINRILKTREQTGRSYTPTTEGGEYYPLPPDYAGMRDIQINTAVPHNDHSVESLVYLSPEEMNTKKHYGGTLYYCVIANQIQLFPKTKAGGSIEMVYYRRAPNLNANAPSNWLSQSHPDIYLSGLMGEIETFVKNYDVAKTWYSKMNNLISEMEVSDVKERWSGTQLTTRIG